MQELLVYLKNFKYTLMVCGVLVVFVVGFTVFYALGFRVGPGLSLMRAGTLTLTGLPVGTSVYIDQAYSRSSADGKLSLDLLPGTHSIIAAAPDMQPWNELISIEATKETAIQAIFVEKDVIKTRVSASEEAGAQALLAAAVLPTKEHPLTMADGCTLVYVDQNRIIAQANAAEGCIPPAYLCQNGTCNPTIALSPEEPIGGILAYPGRSDAIVYAAGSLVAVLELDPRAPQFFAPLVRVNNAKIAPWSKGTLLVGNTSAAYTFAL